MSLSRGLAAITTRLRSHCLHRPASALQKQEEQERRDANVQKRTAPPRRRWKKASDKELSPEEARARVQQRREIAEALSKQERGNGQTASLVALFGRGNSADAPVLLVDGYNAAHKLEDSKALLRAGDWNGARSVFQEQLITFATVTEARVTLVWDAMGRNVDGAGARQDRVEAGSLVTVVWSQEAEADNYILRAARRLLDEGSAWVMVATSDRQEHELAREEGTYVMSSEELVRAMAKAGKGAAEAFREHHELNAVRASTLMGGAVAGGMFTQDEHKAGQLDALLYDFKCVDDMKQARAQGVHARDFYSTYDALQAKQRAAAKLLEISQAQPHDRWDDDSGGEDSDHDGWTGEDLGGWLNSVR